MPTKSNDFHPYDKTQYTAIARKLLEFISLRSPELSKEEKGAEALKLASEILTVSRDLIPLSEHISSDADTLGITLESLFDLSPQMQYPSNKRRYAAYRTIYQKSSDLLESLRLHHVGIEVELNLEEETMLHLMGGLEQFVLAAEHLTKDGFKRGPARKEEMASFIERTAIVFQIASGKQFEASAYTSSKEKREWRGKYFSFLEICNFGAHPIHSSEALRKAAERFLEKNKIPTTLD